MVVSVNWAAVMVVAFALSFACGCGRSKDAGADDRPTLVAFGDSLTQGSGVGTHENYPAKLQARLDRLGYRYRVINAGVGGETSFDGLKRVDAIRALRPRIVILAFGANDGLRKTPVEEIRSNLASLISRLRSAGAMVVLAGMELPPVYDAGYRDSFRNMFSELAEEEKVPLTPFLLDGVGGVRALNLSDGLHPNARGYDKVVENVWKALRPLL